MIGCWHIESQFREQQSWLEVQGLSRGRQHAVIDPPKGAAQVDPGQQPPGAPT